jgi:TetR/AcrR family transcriptional regulator
MRGHHKPTRTQVITEYRRDGLLQAAMRVFGKYGFDGATMEQIAHEADVAKGTTYLYYRSKQSIYDATLSRGLAELDDWTRRALDRAPNLHDAIAAFVTARAEYFLEHRDFFRMYVAAISRQITSVKPRASEFQATVDRQTRRLEDAIRRGVADGEIRHVDPAAAALAIFDLTRGLVARAILATREFDVAREVAFVTSLVWNGLQKGKAPAARARRRSEAREARRRARASGRGAPRAVSKADNGRGKV